jgi:hypothetical protein
MEDFIAIIFKKMEAIDVTPSRKDGWKKALLVLGYSSLGWHLLCSF